jgi:formylmethanofuran dehydrogenase subunit A
MLLNVSNLWALEDEYQRGKIEELSYFLSDLLSTCKGFGFKVYNPFEAETWNFKILRESIEQKGKLYNFTPLDVYKALTNANEVLKLPHSLHAHIEGYEDKVGMNNLKIILDNIDFESIKKKQKNPMERDQVIHLAHANAYGLEGDTSELIEILNSNNDIDLDLGMIGFDKINPIITSDRRLATKLMEGQENNYKFIRSANEFEGDSFIGFRKFDKDDPTHCTLWANAIELALNLKNKWQVQLSFNYPHYSHINNLPTFASLLMSHSMRQDFMKDMNDGVLKQTPLNGNEKIINFNEFIIITRASPAKSLGLAKIKGSLAPGADGDLNILNVDMNQIDPSKDYDQLENALRDIEYTIKNGQIIKKGNKIDLERKGKIFWTEGVVDKNTRLEFMKKKKIFYQKYYSIFYESLENSVKGKFLRKI